MEQNIKEIMEEFEKFIQRADENEDIIKWATPFKFSQYCKNLKGRKQYHYYDTYPSLRPGWLTIYSDGKEIYTFRFWSSELSLAIAIIQEEGFRIGYTPVEVIEAKNIYTHKLHNQLGGYNEEN